MRFEPRLFRDDDQPVVKPAGAASDELSADLPDELAALGAQLSDDATSLALAYPADRALTIGTAHHAARHGKRRWLRWTGAAAALLIVLGTWHFIEDRASVDDSPPPHIISAVSHTDTSTSRPLAVADRATSAGKPMAVDNGLPASIFRGLTGAEQEAVIDLMQDNAQQHGQLTI
jgi:hypothetical protein